MSFIKNMKTWKTIIQFCITVLTAIVSSFFVQSCRAGNLCHTDLTDPTDYHAQQVVSHTDSTSHYGQQVLSHTDLTDLTDKDYTLPLHSMQK